jgi:hypothetical protein
MKKYVLLIFWLLFISSSFAQNEETLLMPVSDPENPLQVELEHRRGSITVDAYDGKIVIIHIQERSTRTRGSASEKRIKFPVTATEEDNRIRIIFSPYKNALDVNIQVPWTCDLTVTNQEDGDITVNNLRGELVIDNSGGGIYLNNVSGTAVLSTIEGLIRARFSQVSPGQPMAFSSLDGTIDVRFPKSLDALLKMKSENGQIFSEYDFSPEQIDNDLSKNQPDNAENNWRYVQLNGGGAQILIITYNGDIYLGKNK